MLESLKEWAAIVGSDASNAAGAVDLPISTTDPEILARVMSKTVSLRTRMVQQNKL